MLTSNKASLELTTILTYITTAEFWAGAWNDSSERFILHGQRQVNAYDKLVQNADKFSNTIKWSMLEKDVDGLIELRNIKAIAAQLKVTTGTVISWWIYFTTI